MILRYALLLLTTLPIAAVAQEPCLLFDGQDDQVTLPNEVLNTIGTNPFTIEAWVRGVEADQVTHPRILSNRDAVNNGFMFGIHGIWGGSSHKMLCMQLDGLNYILINNGTYNGSVLDGTCHHVAVSKGTDSLRFYIDGLHVGSKVLQGNPSATTTASTMLIGNDGPDPQPFNGNISQVRLWNHVRSQAEIMADKDYSIPGTSSGLVGYWEMREGNGQQTADKTGTTDGVLGMSPTDEFTDPVWRTDGCPIVLSKQCLIFDGNDDRVTMSSSALNAIGTGDFTVEAQIRATESEQVQHPRILSNRDMVDNGFMFSFHGIWGGSNYKMLCMQLDGLNYILINNGSYNGSLLDGACHHVAVTKSADSLRFYADGMHIGSKVLQGNPSATTSASTMLIGNDAPDPQPFNGNIAQVRVWNAARTQEQIQADMDLSIPGTTPGLVGYWELNESSGQVVIDRTNTANGNLGSAFSAEAEDPAWVSDCCEVLTNVGVEPSAELPSFILHPNPVTDILSIETGTLSGATHIAISDMLGRKVLEATTYSNGRIALPVDHLAKGSYILVLRNGSTVSTLRFVKN